MKAINSTSTSIPKFTLKFSCKVSAIFLLSPPSFTIIDILGIDCNPNSFNPSANNCLASSGLNLAPSVPTCSVKSLPSVPFTPTPLGTKLYTGLLILLNKDETIVSLSIACNKAFLTFAFLSTSLVLLNDKYHT